MGSRLIIGITDLIICTIFILIAVKLIKHRAPRNGLIGFRIRKAYESDENWYSINEYGGRRLLIWSIPVGIIGIIALAVPISQTALEWCSYAPLILLAAIAETAAFARKL
ncbi:MAG: SdpI family protein [Methylocystaceae bacterium]